MLKNILRVVLALSLAFVAYLFIQAANSEDELPNTLSSPDFPEQTVVAVGSCNREQLNQDYWNTIGEFDPDAWIWLGDNVYADSRDTSEIAAAYDRQKNDPQYRAFRDRVPHLFGIYDDHDYGGNDAGKEWPIRAASRDLMLRFLDVPADDPVWQREGGYQAYTIGEEGRRIKIILLDTRYFRDNQLPGSGTQRYAPNPDGDILGEQQWAWLGDQLRDSGADVHLIGSSIQVLSAQHPYEKWANFPAARQRLLGLLAETQPARPLLLSGDRHVAELSAYAGVRDTLNELTASGLTHAYENAQEDNDLRVSPLIGQRNFGLLTVVWGEDEGAAVLVEARSAETGARFFARGLWAADAGMNPEELTALTYPKDQMSNQLKPCPDKPNCVSTQATQADKKRDPISFSGTAAEARRRLMDVVGDLPRTTLVTDRDNYLHYTFKTFPIPFIDDVEFLIDEEEKVIHYRSASRVGHSDLGVNGRRMAKIVKAMME